MKAILEFDLNDQEDRIRHLRCAHSLDMVLFIWELKNNFISEVKKEELTPDQIIERLQEMMNDLDFNIDKLGS